MSSLDDLPQRDSTHDIEAAAETAFRAAVEACKLFVVQRADRNDYGTDIQIEARDGRAMTNFRAHVQLKGTGASSNEDGSVSVSVARTNLNYLLAQVDSIYVCYHLPSKRLLVRYADDVYREYEHRGSSWGHQDQVTVRFAQVFDEEFQRHLNARLLASGRGSRDHRLRWVETPPDQLSALLSKATTVIPVPADPVRARAVLVKLYDAGQDALISNAFDQFSSTLGSLPGDMDLAYMAEINLGINGLSFNEVRVRRGIEVLQDALREKRADPGSLQYCIGNGWLALREYEKARNAYRAALMQIRDERLSWLAAQCFKNLGSALEALDDMDAARTSYEIALKLDSGLSEAHFALALWYRNKGDNLLALEHLDQVMPGPGSEQWMDSVHGWRIDLLFKTGNVEGAFREINSLLREARRLDWVWPWCARNVATFGKGSVDAARKSLRFWGAYLREHPEDDIAEMERLLCLWHIRQSGGPVDVGFAEFKRDTLRAMEKGTSDPAYLWDRIGHWAQCEKDWVEAELCYRKAYELQPDQFGYCLGTALNSLHRFREALPILLAQATKHQPDAMSWFQVAVAREGVGDIEGCISAYQRALELDPDYDIAWFNLGGMYWNSGDVERATDIWSKAVARFPDHHLAQKVQEGFLIDTNEGEEGQ